MSQDRATFQQLAEARLAEARLLLANGHPSGAYYLAGYAIECALKAKIAADFRANEIPELKRVQNVYTHDLSALLTLANLTERFDAERKANPRLYQRWTTIKEWSEKARYVISTEVEASAILDAVDGDEGMLQWLRNRW
ncbi:MAG: DNA-binding protein [Pseudomonadota bacterium]